MLQNLDILYLLEKDMEGMIAVGLCPKCHDFPLMMRHRDNGDKLFYCMKCNKPFFRFGEAGPLCEHGIGR